MIPVWLLTVLHYTSLASAVIVLAVLARHYLGAAKNRGD